MLLKVELNRGDIGIPYGPIYRRVIEHRKRKQYPEL